jgi:hypothetical protein
MEKTTTKAAMSEEFMITGGRLSTGESRVKWGGPVQVGE